MRYQARAPRRGAAAVEFAIVAPVLFLLFFGMMEFSRALMVSGAAAAAARAGARAGSTSAGSYAAVDEAVRSTLTQASIAAPYTLTVTATAAGGRATTVTATNFAATAPPGSALAVTVAVNYDDVSWLPAGLSRFFGGSQLRGTVVMRKES